ncbi:MAG TPA: carboxypeptidase regulatory-like domain-containing protein [Anaeromyxobacter sp.]|nr:carboxypeptidase regulatory-like domain-containing protein [Anaeromyxobacter sp.]
MLFSIVALTLAAVPAGSAADVPLPPGELRGEVLSAGGPPVTRFTVNGVRFEDPQGRFKILTPPEGEFRVVVRADGFAPNVFHVQGASGKKLTIPEIRLGQGEHVLGEVVDAETGVPVRDARASLADPAKLERLRFVRPERVAGLGVSGGGGWFELRRAPRGLLVLVVQHPDYLPEFVPVNTREPLPAVKLHRGGTITGTVRDANGAVMPGVRVVALSEDANDGAEASADVRGRFEMRRLRPGNYRIAATSFGRAVEAAFQVPLGDGMIADVSVELKSRVRQMDLPEIQLGGELPAPAPAGALASR